MAEVDDNLKQILTDIALAIKEKKEDGTDIQAINFDTEILNIPIKLIPNSGTEKRIAGEDLFKGELIRLQNEMAYPYLGNFYGIAKNAAKEGEEVEIYTPFASKDFTNIDIILNTGESGNYGFKQIEGKYYRSQNKGVDNSYSKARINITTTTAKTIYFYCNCYAETNYDYGLISYLDEKLSSSNSDNSESIKWNKIHTNNSNDYSRYSIYVPGDGQEHFIEIKYRKDGSASNYNDYLQFYYEIEEPMDE